MGQKKRTALARSVSMPCTDGMRFIFGVLVAALDFLCSPGTSGSPSTCVMHFESVLGGCIPSNTSEQGLLPTQYVSEVYMPIDAS